MFKIELSNERINELEEKITKSKQIFQQVFDRFAMERLRKLGYM